MITSNFIHRTFRLRCGGATATAFTIDVDGREYLVTARHVLTTQPGTAEIQVFGGGQWIGVGAQLVGHGQGDVDISVLATDRPLTPPDLPVQATLEGLIYGQEVFFLGFPYELLGNFCFTEYRFPLPFVKRATLSCFDGDRRLLDGHNNRGFSGGPVVFAPQETGPPNSIAAVISGYMSAEEPVLRGKGNTGLTYPENTGIIISYRIEHAISLARARPIGVAR